MAMEVEADALACRIEGPGSVHAWWNGKQEFPMKQSVLTHARVHLLLYSLSKEGKNPRTKAPKI